MKNKNPKGKAPKRFYQDETTLKELTMEELNLRVREFKANGYHEEGRIYAVGEYFCQKMVKEYPPNAIALA